MASKLKQYQAFRNISVTTLNSIHALSQSALSDPASHKSLFAIWYKQVGSCKETFDLNQAEIIAILADRPDQLLVENEIGVDFLNKFVEIEMAFAELFPVPSPSTSHNRKSIAETKPFIDHLQRISLPKFDGGIRNWPHFRDLFIKLVDEKPYGDVEKYHFLVGSLTGEPLDVVKALPISGDNYRIAFNTLLNRYNNERSLATLYWNEIQNIPAMASESASSLRNLLNKVKENCEALKLLKLVDIWEFVLFNIVVNKLDPSTRKQIEMKLDKRKIPAFSDIENLLNEHCLSLEALAAPLSLEKPTSFSKSTKPHSYSFPGASKSFAKTTLVTTSLDPRPDHFRQCILCNSSHSLFACPTFKGKHSQERFEIVKRHRLCLNCLAPGHIVANCSSDRKCRSCDARHHTLLHFSPRPSNPIAQPIDSSPCSSQLTSCTSRCSSTFMAANSGRPPVLLGTISLEIRDKYGAYHIARALIDSGSQASYITSSLVNKLKLPRQTHAIPICGLGHIATESSSSVTSEIRPSDCSNPVFEFDFFVLDKICGNLPNDTLDPNIRLPRGVRLADALWYQSRPVQLLLGADVYPLIARTTLDSAARFKDHPFLLGTVFGQVILGPINSAQTQRCVQSLLSSFPSSSSSLEQVVEQFWNVEEVPSKVLIAPEEELAESSFKRSLFRENSGRFGVALPFKVSDPDFEGSRAIADRRLRSLEFRLASKPIVRSLYVDFMRDYLDSGHMTPLSSEPIGNNCYYIPHHSVFKSGEENSKIRVVFDASAKASNRKSLNDTLLVGPKLQNNIVQLLLQFRLHSVVFTCDVRQMYRQILIRPEDRKYQLIRWRFSPTDPITTYQLNTVTYGVSSAPFLAIRTLLELADLGQEQFPLAAQGIRTNLYVDDLLCGAASVDDAKNFVVELVNLFALGCFELRKWTSNRMEVLDSVPLNDRQPQTHSFDGNSDSTIKILGLQWYSTSDTFSFIVNPREIPCSKRSLLSQLARIYDPLGFLAPVSFVAKCLIQQIWLLGLGWDAVPPPEIISRWNQFKSELPALASLQIPRNVIPDGFSSCALHGFCDASERGYAAVVYLCFSFPDGTFVTRLVISKSKVAPVKQLSIPRLELCAAALLAKLVKFVLETFRNLVVIDNFFAWSDSTIVLTWVRSLPRQWKVFVSNRVAYIHERISPGCWHYIPSQQNPADPASRGLLPSEILSHTLWWSGPTFLSNPLSSWPPQPIDISPRLEELEPKYSTIVSCFAQNYIGSSDHFVHHLLTRVSSLNKIQVTVAYILRFCHNLRHPSDKYIGPLSSKECHNALLLITRVIQEDVFLDLISRLHSNRSLPRWFAKLSPMVGGDNLIRVGSRLDNSSLPFESKHPALLPRSHRLTELVVRQIHENHYHAGITTTMYLVQQNFWIISARRSIRHYLSKCNRCFRINPIPYCPPTGNLPSLRVSQIKPFSVVGCDFAGPFSITSARIRGVKVLKAYLCLFVCFATKAVHLESATSLSTEAFMGALRRFIARRGRCVQIFSDCGTNFVGANREFNRLMKTSVESQRITWSFNPPSAPHFGGLWESGVKSVKKHFVRVVGDQILSLEEFNTVISEIEAILNSRPLCPLSTDPNDLNSLTPGHFLTLEPLSAPPDPDLSHLATSRLSRWQLVQQLQQSFWARWRSEYLHTLYQKSHWALDKKLVPADIGILVLVKDETTPSLKWRLGRIQQLHPGSDGIARVASVLTVRGVIKRPLVKLCALPSQ